MARNKSVKQPPVLFKQTQKYIDKLSDYYKHPVITYWNNPRGSVCSNDVLVLYELLEKIGHNDRIYLFIKSDGGNGTASLRFVNLIRQYCNKLIALIPIECSSAATMIALGADEIHMGPMSYLSAVDTSLTHDLSPIDRDNDRVSVSLDELKRVVQLWQKEKCKDGNPYQYLYQYVHPLVIGAVDRADSLSVMLCKEILSYHLKDRTNAIKIAEDLNSKYPSHSYPILLKEAVRLGLKAKAMSHEVHSILLDLNNLYSEMGQKATTDFDETNAHGNEIINILEGSSLQIYFQQDKHWFYRSEERRWITLNDNSSWRKNQMVKNKIQSSTLHI